jgi:hypothetical protein
MVEMKSRGTNEKYGGEVYPDEEPHSRASSKKGGGGNRDQGCCSVRVIIVSMIIFNIIGLGLIGFMIFYVMTEDCVNKAFGGACEK